MAHDPLCLRLDECATGVCLCERCECECVLIAKVREDMLAKCIALIEESVPWSTENWIAVDERAAILTALRALQEVDTPQQELNEHINFDTANRIGDDTTLQNAGREPYKSPNGQDKP